MINLSKNNLQVKNFKSTCIDLITLLRWDKPSGRLILLIPAGWSLWLAPSAPPGGKLFSLIMVGGVLVSGAGCIANDLWDKKIDAQVKRTQERPLATKRVRASTAITLLFFLLLASLQIIFLLPASSQPLCIYLAVISLIPILLYPSAKRWFKYPQALLSICWGFAVLIPWAAIESDLNGGLPLATCWLSTMVWTFGFDTVYAMADIDDDKKLGLNSSAIALGNKAFRTVSACYGMTSILIASSALTQGIGMLFWPIWIIATFGMQREIFVLKQQRQKTRNFSRHFLHQVFLGSLILLGLILGSA